jgi:hypothetical protein
MRFLAFESIVGRGQHSFRAIYATFPLTGANSRLLKWWAGLRAPWILGGGGRAKGLALPVASGETAAGRSWAEDEIARRGKAKASLTVVR